jgi:hypothetical protein
MVAASRLCAASPPPTAAKGRSGKPEWQWQGSAGMMPDVHHASAQHLPNAQQHAQQVIGASSYRSCAIVTSRRAANWYTQCDQPGKVAKFGVPAHQLGHPLH